ncbi:glycosyltransferase family 2 protein [Dyadobacter psychrotolerans]|nr:glycosyltransferase [Dyadobacter psychrotolerans]
MIRRTFKSIEIPNKLDLDRNKALSKVENIISHHQNTSKVTIITPTTGSQFLGKAIESVINQSYVDVLHLIIVDGEQSLENTEKVMKEFNSTKLKLMVIPHNTGKGGMNGHRIYAAIPYLVNSDFIFLLDEDNWYEPNHVSSLVDIMEKEGLDWIYSMRNIYTHDENFVAMDNCESLGNFRPYSNQNNLVDTNCYGFRRSRLVKSAYLWYHPLKADRYFFHHIKKYSPKFKSSRKYTVNYRLKEARPLFPEFFLKGNEFMLEKYRGKLPWLV